MPNFKNTIKEEGENYTMLVDEFKEMIDRLNTVLCVYDFDEDTCESIQSAIDDLEEAISTLVNEGDDEEGDEE